MSNTNHSHCGCGDTAVDAALAAASIVRGYSAKAPAGASANPAVPANSAGTTDPAVPAVEGTSGCGCGGNCGCAGDESARPVIDEGIVDRSEGRRDLGLRGLPA